MAIRKTAAEKAAEKKAAASVARKATAWPENCPTTGIRVGVDSKPIKLDGVPVDSKGVAFNPEKHRIHEETGAVALTPGGKCISLRGRASYGGIRSDIQKLHREIAKSKDFIAWALAASRKGVALTLDQFHTELTKWCKKHRPKMDAKALEDFLSLSPLTALPKMRYNILTDPGMREYAKNKFGITFPETQKEAKELWMQRVEEVAAAINFPEFVGISHYQSSSAPRLDEGTLDDLFG